MIEVKKQDIIAFYLPVSLDVTHEKVTPSCLSVAQLPSLT